MGVHCVGGPNADDGADGGDGDGLIRAVVETGLQTFHLEYFQGVAVARNADSLKECLFSRTIPPLTLNQVSCSSLTTRTTVTCGGDGDRDALLAPANEHCCGYCDSPLRSCCCSAPPVHCSASGANACWSHWPLTQCPPGHCRRCRSSVSLRPPWIYGAYLQERAVMVRMDRQRGLGRDKYIYNNQHLIVPSSCAGGSVCFVYRDQD